MKSGRDVGNDPMEASQNGKCSVCNRFCCMEQTFKSLISQFISARVFSEKPGDFRYSSGDRKKRRKTGSLPAKPGGLAGLQHST